MESVGFWLWLNMHSRRWREEKGTVPFHFFSDEAREAPASGPWISWWQIVVIPILWAWNVIFWRREGNQSGVVTKVEREMLLFSFLFFFEKDHLIDSCFLGEHNNYDMTLNSNSETWVPQEWVCKCGTNYLNNNSHTFSLSPLFISLWFLFLFST